MKDSRKSYTLLFKTVNFNLKNIDVTHK